MVASLAIVGTCGCGHEGGVCESLPWLLPSVLFVFVIQVNTSHTGGAIPVPVLVEGSFQVLAEGPPAALHSETLSPSAGQTWGASQCRGWERPPLWSPWLQASASSTP